MAEQIKVLGMRPGTFSSFLPLGWVQVPHLRKNIILAFPIAKTIALCHHCENPSLLT